MNKFVKTTIALSLAVGFVGSAVAASAIALPGSGKFTAAGPGVTTATVYAREALTSTTVVDVDALDVSFDTFEVTLGVPYRVLLTLTGSEFSGAQPAAVGVSADPFANVSCVPVTFTGQSASQFAWECTSDINAKIGVSFAQGDLKLTQHTLASGGTVRMAATLQSREGFANYDSIVSQEIANGQLAVVVIATSDSATNANVNDAAGPLFGFVPANDDIRGTAKASFTVANNVVNAVCPDVATAFDMTASCGAYDHDIAGVGGVTGALRFTLTDSQNFAAAALNGVRATSKAGDEVGIFALNGSTGTLTVVPQANDFPLGFTTTVDVSYEATLTSSLGPVRTIGFESSLNGGGQASGVDNKSTWWNWSNNGTVLKFPSIRAASGGTGTWIQLTNTNSVANATFTTTCFTTSTSAGVAGTSGVVPAGRANTYSAAALCPQNGASAAILTFAMPEGNVLGVVRRLNGTTGQASEETAVGVR